MHTFLDFNYVLYLTIDMFYNFDTIFINVNQRRIFSFVYFGLSLGWKNLIC
jgi:hypothetical protein